MLKSAAAVLLLTATLAFAADKPNILFIAVDDLNDWVGCVGGHPLVKTPSIDKLAARGTNFLNAHCQAPLCNPSRHSLLLGLRPSTTGIYALEPSFRTIPELKNRVPLTEYLKLNGYQTFSVGKLWHINPTGADKEKEFTELGIPAKTKMRPDQPFVKTPAGNPLVDWGPFPEKDEDHYDYARAQWAINKLNSKPAGPFFLAVGFWEPHVPCYAPQKYFDLYPDDDSILPKVLRTDREDVPDFSWYLHWKLPEPRLKWLEENNQWRPLVRAYLASVSFADAQVGRVLEALQDNGYADNTIIVVWGDHGWHLGEKGLSGKNTLWERSTHVPLIFAGPGISKNARCACPAELLDIFPTLVELCGLPPCTDLEGHSLVPQLNDATAPREWPAITTHGPNNHTVRTKKWRYIRYANGTEELYDEAADPSEWKNLAGETAYAATKTELARWLPKSSAAPVPGSKSRLVELKDGTVYWETKAVDKNEPVPED